MGFLLDLIQQLRQGVWSSFTGGWYYDPYHKIFTNTIHLYLWLFFFCFPFSIHLYLPAGSHYLWIYTGTIFIAFTVIKTCNRILHHLFDNGEVHEVKEDEEDEGKEAQGEGTDSIELRDMSKNEYTDEWRLVPSLRLPSIHEEATSSQQQTDRSAFPAGSSREYSNSSRFDLKVDVHKPVIEGRTVGLRGGAGPGEGTSGGKGREGEGSQGDGETDRGGDKWGPVQPDEVIDINPEKSDVVILVDEGNVPHSPPVPLATVLEEAKHSGGGVSFDASNGEVSVSFSTTSSQLTMQGVPGSDTTRRYSNISNLARSIRSEPGATSLQPVTGSLEIMAILDPNLSQIGTRRGLRNSRNGRNVRRTKSVLDTGLGCVAPMSMSSYPVSLDAGMNQAEFKHRSKPTLQALKTLELKESQISEASEEGSLDPGGDNKSIEDRLEEHAQGEKEKSEHSSDVKESGGEMEGGQKQEMKEASSGNQGAVQDLPEDDVDCSADLKDSVSTETMKLLMTGAVIRSADSPASADDEDMTTPPVSLDDIALTDFSTSSLDGKSVVTSRPADDETVTSSSNAEAAEPTTSKDISIQTDPNALSPGKYRILFVSESSPAKSSTKEVKDKQSERVKEGTLEELTSGQDDEKSGDKSVKWWEALRGPDSSDEDKHLSPEQQEKKALEIRQQEQLKDCGESPKKKKMKESPRSSSEEPKMEKSASDETEDLDQPQSFLSNLGIDWLFSDSEPDDGALSSPKQVPSADEGRGTVRKVESVSSKTQTKSRDSSHGSSGTDTETRTLLNKLEEVEASLEAAGGAIPKRSRRLEDRMSRRLYEYELPERTTLHEDAAGLKLFLEILNGSDTENPEAELELKKLIQSKRDMLEGNRRQHQPEPHRTRRRLAQRRKRRHAAEPQPEEQYPPSEPLPEAEIDSFGNPSGNQPKYSVVRGRVRRRLNDRKRPPPAPSSSTSTGGTGNVGTTETHLAENHEDTSSGAVHCFQDEFGNWQTYTFGGETQTSTVLTSGYGGGGAGGSSGSGGGGGSSRSRVFPRSIFTGYSTDPASSTSRRPSNPIDGGGDEWRSLRKRATGGSSDMEAGGTSLAVGSGGGDGYSSNPNYTANSRSSSESGFTVILDSPAMVFRPASVDRQRSQDSNSDNFWSTGSGNRDNGNSGRYNVNASTQAFRRNNPFSFFTENLLDRLPGATAVPEMLPFNSDGSPFLSRLEDGTGGGRGVNLTSNSGNLGSMHSGTPKVKKYHLLKLPGMKGVKIWLDRLQMLNILDQDPSIYHTILAVLLATATAVLGSMVIQEGYCKDLWLVLFCLVLCSSQYSLLKSVQPDASSPAHGFNMMTVYSRPVYFLIFCSLALILDTALKGEVTPIRLYSVDWCARSHLVVARDIMYIILLSFPLIFTLGLLPQINTAAMFIMEQIDIQIFGGNASTSIQSSTYCLVRSLLANIILVGFAYGGLTEGTHSAHAQQVLFSIFCALAVSMAYHLSRASGDPTVLLSILKRHFLAIISEDTPTLSPSQDSKKPPTTPEEDPTKHHQTPQDPLPKKLRETVNKRLTNDCIMVLLISVIVFLVVQSDVFDQAYPYLDMVLWLTGLLTGFLLHYLLPHMRKENPWKCLAAPILKSNEHEQFEVHKLAVVMWWEKFLVWAVILEKSVLYPAIFLSAVYQDKTVFSSLFGLLGGSLIMSICLLKCLRICYSDSSRQFVILLLSILIFQYNPQTRFINNLEPGFQRTSPFLLDYFLTSILVHKLIELYLKCQFVITYAAPHRINWGSPFHAFAQPFSVPHSAMLFLQAALSSALSSPLNPFLGSTIFLCSYARPVKFWERNYNTKRVDNSNTRLSSQVEMRNPGADDNNLNSIFYEHLTRSLQHSLAGDIMLGRWGEVQQGDFFFLNSDNLNCLVHIIELGNGICTFQVRGLEFRGTYCHQREVEAISEGVEDDEGCCCFKPGHLPHLLSLNAALSQRWLAWEVSAVKYVLEGYSISDNSAQAMFQVFDLRKRLVSYYIKSIIYYTVRSPKLKDWLASPTIQEAIKNTSSKNFVDLDPLFNSNIDEDFDFRVSGITRSSFCNIYLSWIQYCARSRDRTLGSGKDSDLVSLCLALSLLGRRALGAAGHNALCTMEFFLVGLYSLFKGDFRITSVRDEWVFSDMELLRRVVAPGVRMSLKLHQDHFMLPDEYEDHSVLYDAITAHEKDLVISHEGDPAWRAAVLSGAPSLLALRHGVDDGSEDYKIIMLNKRFLSFRVIKLNRECVRGLWAGQQQELIFFRNRNPERGSIQNAKYVLRNIINSSCDQPLGYPIYVSPLTTSYADTNEQIRGIVGGPLSLGVFKKAVQNCWERIWDKCIGSCSTGSRGVDCDINTGGECILPEHLRAGSLPANRSSLVSSVSKPSTGTIVSLAGLLATSHNSAPAAGGQANQGPPTTGSTPTNNQRNKDDSCHSSQGVAAAAGTPAARAKKQRSSTAPQLPVARIIDPLMVYDKINQGRRIDPVWPEPEWRAKGGRNAWNNWIPLEEMKGPVVHRWTPLHAHPMHRSHTDKTILLLKIEDKYVPIAEHAVEIMYQDTSELGRSPKNQTSSMDTSKSPAKDLVKEKELSASKQALKESDLGPLAPLPEDDTDSIGGPPPHLAAIPDRDPELGEIEEEETSSEHLYSQFREEDVRGSGRVTLQEMESTQQKSSSLQMMSKGVMDHPLADSPSKGGNSGSWSIRPTKLPTLPPIPQPFVHPSLLTSTTPPSPPPSPSLTSPSSTLMSPTLVPPPAPPVSPSVEMLPQFPKEMLNTLPHSTVSPVNLAAVLPRTTTTGTTDSMTRSQLPQITTSSEGEPASLKHQESVRDSAEDEPSPPLAHKAAGPTSLPLAPAPGGTPVLPPGGTPVLPPGGIPILPPPPTAMLASPEVMTSPSTVSSPAAPEALSPSSTVPDALTPSPASSEATKELATHPDLASGSGSNAVLNTQLHCSTSLPLIDEDSVDSDSNQQDREDK